MFIIQSFCNRVTNLLYDVASSTTSREWTTLIFFYQLHLDLRVFNISVYLFLSGNLTKSGSESSLSDACETTSAKETARRHEEKDTCSDNEEPTQSPQRKPEVVDLSEDVKDSDDALIKQEVEDSIEQAKEIPSDAPNGEEVKEDLTHRSKLQKQGNVVLRRKSKGNLLYRKSTFS